MKKFAPRERVLSFTQRKEIVEKHFKNKISQVQLAKDYGVSRLTINRHCQKNGISPMIKRRSGINKEIVVDLYVNKKFSMNQISDKLLITRRDVSRILKESGVNKKELSKNKRNRWNHEIPQYRLREDIWAHKVIDRDNLKCKQCGSIEKLEAHHIVPVRDLDNSDLLFDINNGITLCQKCHKKTIYHEYEFVDLFFQLIKQSSV